MKVTSEHRHSRQRFAVRANELFSRQFVRIFGFAGNFFSELRQHFVFVGTGNFSIANFGSVAFHFDGFTRFSTW